MVDGRDRGIIMDPDGTLSIRQVGPTKIGVYTCTVTSSLGSDSRSGQLSIIGKYIVDNFSI